MVRKDSDCLDPPEPMLCAVETSPMVSFYVRERDAKHEHNSFSSNEIIDGTTIYFTMLFYTSETPSIA